MSYCPYDKCVLQEFIFQGDMRFVCANCNFYRDLAPEETLLFERRLDSSMKSGVISSQDVARDKINNRVPIDCKCGSKVGIISVNGPDCNVILVCHNCHANVELS